MFYNYKVNYSDHALTVKFICMPPYTNSRNDGLWNILNEMVYIVTQNLIHKDGCNENKYIN